jgi:23S rRNA pseudouridine955/2504/2580 synthase
MISYIAKKDAKLTKSVLKEYPLISYTILMKLIRKSDVKVNGKRVNKDVDLTIGDKVELYYNLPEKSFYAQIYCDENVLIINKQSGITAEEIFDKIKQEYKGAKFIHRLDRNTSGLMVFALNSSAEKELLLGFKNHLFDKRYTCVVKGLPSPKKAVLTAYLVKDKEQSLVKIFDKKVAGSTMIKTGYEVIEESQETSTLKVRLFTGKTHQIRAHLAHIGYPILGDEKYGDSAFNKKYNEKKQNLVSSSLTFYFDKNSPLYYLNEQTFSLEK